MTETIVAAAIKFGKVVCIVERPARHHDVFHAVAEAGWVHRISPHIQGFVTSTGRFVEREEARKIAEQQGQLIASVDNAGTPVIREHSQLFSEDVW